MFNKETNIVYLDMDGVLADFDKFVLENLGRTFDHNESEHKTNMWASLSKIDRFYYNLELTPYAKDLLSFVREHADNVEILTAIPRRGSIPTADFDKIDWARDKLCSNLKVNLGPYSKDKWKHAKPGDILIDDRLSNINDWNRHGGIGLLHIYGDFADTQQKFLNAINKTSK